MKHYFWGPGKDSIVHSVTPHFLRVPGCSWRPVCAELRWDKVQALYFEVTWVQGSWGSGCHYARTLIFGGSEKFHSQEANRKAKKGLNLGSNRKAEKGLKKNRFSRLATRALRGALGTSTGWKLRLNSWVIKGQTTFYDRITCSLHKRK